MSDEGYRGRSWRLVAWNVYEGGNRGFAFGDAAAIEVALPVILGTGLAITVALIMFDRGHLWLGAFFFLAAFASARMKRSDLDIEWKEKADGH